MQQKSSPRLHKGAIAGFLIAGLAAVLLWLVWTGTVAGSRPLCEVCKRTIHSGLSFEFAAWDGSIRRTCCPRCGLVALIQKGGRALWAVDFTSQKPVHAETAIYLEGSDIMDCCTEEGFRTSEGGYREREYDRCLPSLLAFSQLADAEYVRQRHGGRIISFTQARESVLLQLNAR